MASLSVESLPNALGCAVSGLDASHAYTRNFVWQAYLNGVKVVDETTSAPPYSSGASFTMTGLTNGQTYSVVVGIYSSDWQTLFATLYGSGTPSSAPAQKSAYIYHNGEWKPATPYIFHNGAWVPASAKIYTNGGWQ